ncbi:MAG: long-chain fatty acid--CoA ligase [Desulforhopalus sp.]|nr:long-chain fatty acid--CoA ligase [Desulforhopalus sp.]
MSIMSYQSIPAILKDNAKKYGDKAAISYKEKGTYVTLTYEEFYERVLKLARGLSKYGVTPGDKVAIFSENRLGWAIADFAIQSVGGITVPIYATNTGKQAAYIINHCEARVVFCSTKSQYDKLYSIKDDLPNVDLVVSFVPFMGRRSFPVFALDQLSEIDTAVSDEDRQMIEDQIAQITQNDLITVIYTSGTTGVPKGVLLTQRNIMINAEYGIEQLGMPQSGMTMLSFLPLSHVLERTGGYYATLMNGNHLAFAESPALVMENMAEVRPTAMVSVPRLFEKIYSRVYEGVRQMPPARQKIFEKAMEVGREYVNKKHITKEPISLLLNLKYQMYDRLIFKKIRARFGGRLTYFLCGGAPLDKTVCEFMWIIGLPVYNGYGLTETSPALTISGAGKVRFDSVGKPLRETELKLAPDGELLVKGPQVMLGYYKNDEATLDTMQDGWFKTGDIAKIDEEGYVYIVDRKKELIVTAGGKNIAPQPIENELKLDKYISSAIVFGDLKPYLVAIITADIEVLKEYAREEKINFTTNDDLVQNPKIKDLYASRIKELNKSYPPYKTIKYFAVVANDFSIEGGELTPTLKLKRKVILEKYKDLIEDLYAGKGSGDTSR